MNTLTADGLHTAMEHLKEQGYAVIESVLSRSMLAEVKKVMEGLFVKERESPYDPGDGPGMPGDQEIETLLATSYSVTDAELQRVMRLIRYDRHRNHDAPWPVPPNVIPRMFVHLPAFVDHGKTQIVRNLPSKHAIFGELVEHPEILKLARAILGDDCVLSDISANSIGPHTEGGAWHVDSPLNQLPEPLPEDPLSLQCVWMLDEFTNENGATRVVPGSHKRRKKPSWAGGGMEDEVILTGPAGSVAVWLSNNWHRVGPNRTDYPRRAILNYYCRSWVKPFSDYRTSIPEELLKQYSPTLRYLLGFSANGLVRG